MFDRPFDDEDDPWVLTLVVETRKGFPLSEIEVYEAAARVVASGRDRHQALFRAYETAGRIRKLVRHAPAARFTAVSELPECLLVAASGGARVALLAPAPRSRIPTSVTSLQLAVPSDRFQRTPRPRPPTADAPVAVAISPVLEMSVPKTVAQVAHAAQLMHEHLSSEGDHPSLDAWRAVGFATSVGFPALADWGLFARAPVVIRDAGFTEVPAGAHTVSALPRPP